MPRRWRKPGRAAVYSDSQGNGAEHYGKQRGLEEKHRCKRTHCNGTLNRSASRPFWQFSPEQGLQAIKNGGNPRQTTEPGINGTERQENGHGRRHKECSGNNATPLAMQPPPNIDRKLLGFRSGKNHAMARRRRKLRLLIHRFCSTNSSCMMAM